MESSFELGSALLKLIKIKTMENRCVTASFAKTAINLRIEQVLNEKVVKHYSVTYEFGICNSRFYSVCRLYLLSESAYSLFLE